MGTDDPFRASVYCDTAEQRDLAIEVLSEVNANEVHVFDEAVEGWVRPDQLALLTRAGMLVDAVADPEIEPAAPAPAQDPTGRAAEPTAGIAGIDPGATTGKAPADPPLTSPPTGPGLRESAESRAELAEFKKMVGRAVLGADEGWFCIDDQSDAGAVQEALAADPPPAPAVDMFRVRFTRPLRSTEREILASLGLEPLAAEPGNVLLMYLTTAQQEQLRQKPFVQSMAPYGFEASVTPALLDAVRLAKAAESGEQAGLLSDGSGAAEVPDTYDVVCQQPDDVGVVGTIVAGTAGTEILGTSEIMVRVKLSLDPGPLQAFLAGLAHLPQVAKISPYEAPRLYGDFSRKLIGVERVNAAAAVPWTGEGEIVAIFDSGVDATHPDLADRLVVNETLPGATAGDVVGHGTHVAGLVAGSGAASNGQVLGVAPGAKLAVFGVVGPGERLTLPPDLSQLMDHAVKAGAKIINLSWGLALSGTYEGYSMTLDKFLRAHPEVLVVVAAGNSGAAPNGTLDFNSVGTPATAKNVLTVGACQSDRPGFAETWGKRRPTIFSVSPAADETVAGNPDRTANLSSRGPTDYDSVKPDLVAPGTFILSARAANITQTLPWQDCPDFDNRYVYIGGTSMAAPIVTGAAALVRQYLRVARGTPEPSSALVKAILLAAARRLPPMRAPGSEEDVGYPDFDQGYGRLDLASILPTAESPNRRIAFVDVANTSSDALESRSQDRSRKGMAPFRIMVAAGATAPLRVVLTWTDYAAVHVQNNLELVVSPPGRPFVVGNQETTYGKKSSRFHPSEQKEFAGVSFDPANTVEQVTLVDPPPGEYRIRVIAENTPFPPQGYALCVCGDLESDDLVRA